MEGIKRTGVYKHAMFFAFFVMCMAVYVLPNHARAEEADNEITIYGLDSSAMDIISIPNEFPQGHQLTVSNGKTSYRVESGDSAKVSEDGYISPKYTYWKRYPGYSTSVPEGQEYDYYTLKSGDTTIVADTGDRVYKILVHVENYSITYGDSVVETYIKENINDSMSDYDVMKAVAKFPASYEYSASYSSMYSMILHGGGDCWASTDAIIKICEKMGIRAWARNGNKDLGAGSGHMNAMAEWNGVYYELEAGYSMSKVDGYRPYTVTVRESLFSYRYRTSDKIIIYQYDGYETTGVLEIPESIDGKKVTEIGDETFSGAKFSEILLPNTLTTIGEFAFSGCKNLEKITIPASVASIGASVFADCTGMKKISVAQDNPYYKEEGQVIYSKDGKTLVTCPTAGEVSIPNTVTKIEEYAFYYNSNLQKIVIPESVTQMGEGAFGNCSNLSNVTFEGNGITDIGMYCFRSNTALVTIRIPESIKTLGAYSFSYCSRLKHIYFMGDAPIFGGTINEKFYDNVFMGCTANACYVEGETWTEDALSDHGGTITWSVWDGKVGASLENAVITFGEERYVYTGGYITPKITVTIDNVTLVEDKDYMAVFSNNRNAGKATVSVIGIGAYDGSISKTFTIDKAERELSVYLKDRRITEKATTEVILYLSDDENYTYSSSDESVAIIDSTGVITGVSAGNAVITVRVEETENYLAGQASANIVVTHSNDITVVGTEVVNGAIKVQCGGCGKSYDASVPTKYSIYWAEPGDSYYSSYCSNKWQIGESLQCMCWDDSGADLNEIEVVSLNEEVVSITENSLLNFIADGTAQVVVRPKYNPSIGKTFTFYVGDTTGENGEDEPDKNNGNNNNGDNNNGNNNNGGNNNGNDNNGDNNNGNDNNGGNNNGNNNNGGNNNGNNNNGGNNNGNDNKKNDEVGQDTDKNGNGSEKDNVKETDIKYYDKKTGITILVDNGKKSAVVVSVDKKAGKSSLTVPASIKVNGTVYKITEIGKNAWKNNKKLKKIVLGKNIKTIGAGAFSGCSKLQTVVIGKNVSKIGNKAFYKCKKLKSITIQSKKLTGKNVGSNAFRGIYAKASIKVPKSKLPAYKKLLKAKGAGSKVKVKK